MIQGAEEMGRTAAHLLHQMLHGMRLPRHADPGAAGRHQRAGLEPAPADAAARTSCGRCHYIRQYACLGIKTEQVADYVGMSRTVLEEHFKRELKQTVHQVILKYKLDTACDLIANSDVPLADIALRCGFTSLQYMYAVFRREYDCTPRQFVEQVRSRA